ncbi:sugar ABC transporter substrate-binding protein [Microbacterium invictum]|uniref:Ribose transport system substrate-binding protein n=1 Tax=Microbacterium invictum TaxID=515415 RepID=A0AA40SSF6_9MICO|nr:MULTISPECIES: sugar ABC transporter substrate-binding protein [Microbacterium]MBB4141372.1 ribose transport system substrate-binding protein [Microbacterium invictum]
MRNPIPPSRRRGRRIALAAAALTVALSVTGCAATSTAPEPSGDAPETVEPGSIKLGIAYWDTRTYAFQLMLKGAEAVAAADPAIDLESAAPDAGDPSKLLPLFQAMSQTQTDGIVLQTLAADPFYRPVQQVTSAGTPVIAIDAPPPADAGVDLFITNDNVELGRMLAREILASVPEDASGQIIIGTNGPAVPPLMARVDGMIEVLAAERPGVEVVGPISTYGTSGSTQENFSAWDGIWRQYPNALAYLAPGAQDAVSLALVQQRNDVELLAGGMDLEPAAIEAVQDGYVAALVSPEHWLKGYISTKLLAAHAESGAEIPVGTWDTGGLVVNADNIDEVIARQASDAAMSEALAAVGDEQIANSADYIIE